MVGQNYKNDLKDHRETETILEVDGCKLLRQPAKSKLSCKTLTGISVLCLFLLNATLIYYVVNKNTEIQQLHEQFNALARDVDKLKYRFLDDDLLDEIKAFRNEGLSDTQQTGLTKVILTSATAADRALLWPIDLIVVEPRNDNDTEIDQSTKRVYYFRSIKAYTDTGYNKNASKIVVNSDDFDNEDYYDAYDEYNEDDVITDITVKDLGEQDNDATEAPSRIKREVLGTTLDGVPIIAESYSERKRNKTLVTNVDGLRLHEAKVKHYAGSRGWTPRTYVNSPNLRPASPTPVMTRTSRVMHTHKEKPKVYRNVVKKSLKSAVPESTGRVYAEQVLSPEATVTRNGTVHRRRKHGSRGNLETMDHPRMKRSMVLVHFHGDTSKYVYGQHQHYKANGRLAHPEGQYVDWAPSSWVQSLGMDRHFQMADGVLTVKDAGLYFIYAQIFYLDEHDTNGYKIYRNDKELIAQCTTMTHSERPVAKSNTCYTATVHYLAEDDRVVIKDVENLRYSLFEDGKSFFGLIRISDMKAK